MKSLLFVFLVAVLFSLLMASPVAAADIVTGSCPSGFTLHEVGDHLDHPEHHKGLAADLNGNGFLCMKELGNGLHVHVDDVVQSAGS